MKRCVCLEDGPFGLQWNLKLLMLGAGKGKKFGDEIEWCLLGW